MVRVWPWCEGVALVCEGVALVCEGVALVCEGACCMYIPSGHTQL